MVKPVTIGRGIAAAGSLVALGLAMHTAVNLRRLRRPTARASLPARAPERVSVLIPARNEELSIAAAIESVRGQHTSIDAPTGCCSTSIELEVLVLDDGSSDATGAIAETIAHEDARVRVLRAPDDAPPPGWLGKTWACARLAEESSGSVLVFMDADVTLQPTAVLALVTELRDAGFAMVAPYPYQEAGTWFERLVQPLVTWSWVATMPLGWAERSTRPSLSAANGQLLAVDARSYRAVGGHASVAGDVIEDVGLMRAFKRAGFRTATVDGSHLAQCRMYASTSEVVDGYTKSLWAAFNGPAGSIAATALLIGAYVMPAVGVLTARRRSTRTLAAAGYLSGVASRALVARRTGERVLPDALLHPASVSAFAILTALSWSRHLRGTNTWKGRPVR